MVGAAASQAEARKVIKYANFSHTHMFTAIETLGVWGPGATELAASIGRRITILYAYHITSEKE